MTNAVRKLREAKGWSQEDLARKADVTLSTIRRLERGDGGPSLQTAVAVAFALDVELPDLFPPVREVAS